MQAKLLGIERRRNSPSGNPWWWLHFEGYGWLSTVQDSMFGYEIAPCLVGKTFDVKRAPGSVVLVEDMTEVAP